MSIETFKEQPDQESLEENDDREYFDRIVGTSEYQFAEQYWKDQLSNEEELKTNNLFTSDDKKGVVKEEFKKAEESLRAVGVLTGKGKDISDQKNVFKKVSQKENQKLIGDVFKEIEVNLKDQPESVQKIYQEKKDEFKTFATINGKDFVFCNENEKEVLALVRDGEFPNRWKTRAFRISGSDRQWKVLSGMREDGYSFMKGEESNPLHHYVQSAKLDKNIYQVISSLPKNYTDQYNVKEYIPIKNGEFNKELEFKESYLELKNKEWKHYQQGAQWFFHYFLFFNNSRKQLELDAQWYKNVKKYEENIGGYKKIAESIEELFEDPITKEYLEDWYKMHPGNKMDIPHLKRGENSKHYEKFIKKYQEGVNEFFEYGFSHSIPKGLIPDFSKERIVDSYKKEQINIEEYEVRSPEGDNLIFAMAYDEKGRVYIDNVYDPSVGMNDYGVPNKICQMGHLVYKPEDYNSQVFGIPEKYKKISDSGYVDISAFWENIPIVKNFKEELIERGVISN